MRCGSRACSVVSIDGRRPSGLSSPTTAALTGSAAPASTSCSTASSRTGTNRSRSKRVGQPQARRLDPEQAGLFERGIAARRLNLLGIAADPGGKRSEVGQCFGFMRRSLPGARAAPCRRPAPGSTACSIGTCSSCWRIAVQAGLAAPPPTVRTERSCGAAEPGEEGVGAAASTSAIPSSSAWNNCTSSAGRGSGANSSVGSATGNRSPRPGRGCQCSPVGWSAAELRRQLGHPLGGEEAQQRLAAAVGSAADQPALAQAMAVDAVLRREHGRGPRAASASAWCRARSPRRPMRGAPVARNEAQPSVVPATTMQPGARPRLVASSACSGPNGVPGATTSGSRLAPHAERVEPVRPGPRATGS